MAGEFLGVLLGAAQKVQQRAARGIREELENVCGSGTHAGTIQAIACMSMFNYTCRGTLVRAQFNKGKL